MTNAAPLAKPAKMAKPEKKLGLVGEAVFTGLAESVKAMRAAMDRGRAGVSAQ